jgi:hypothetical protein
MPLSGALEKDTKTFTKKQQENISDVFTRPPNKENEKYPLDSSHDWQNEKKIPRPLISGLSSFY